MRSLLLLILLLPVSGCAYNSVNITAQGDVNCTAMVDKPTSVSSLPINANGNTVPVSAIP